MTYMYPERILLLMLLIVITLVVYFKRNWKQIAKEQGYVDKLLERIEELETDAKEAKE